MNTERTDILTLIAEAQGAGARQAKACALMGISARTVQRWDQPGHAQDGRLEAKREPANKLTELERQRIITMANEKEYAGLPPGKIVPQLADQGHYIASESTFYRVLKASHQLHHRQKARPTGPGGKRPKALTATAANQVYTWDITYLPTLVRGLFLYLYLVLDIYSRKIVGWQVYEDESSALAAELMTDLCQREGIARDQVTLHSDNGGPMKGATLLATLQELGVIPSFGRPGVSDDNPYSESLFRTLKYCPEYPEHPFADLAAARRWVQEFVDWYNQVHLHSSIKFVTPDQRHLGKDVEILAKRHQVYLKAKAKNPNRWSGETRNWQPIKEVRLNPEKQKTERKENKAA